MEGGEEEETSLASDMVGYGEGVPGQGHLGNPVTNKRP